MTMAAKLGRSLPSLRSNLTKMFQVEVLGRFSHGVVLVTPPSSVCEGLKMHHDTCSGSYDDVLSEWNGVRRWFESLGVAVHTAPACDYLPDSVFVQDPAIILQGANGEKTLIIGRLGASSRRSDFVAVENLLLNSGMNFSEVIDLRNDVELSFECGDFIPIHTNIGKVLLIGKRSSKCDRFPERTNQAGINRVSKIARDLGYQVVIVEHKALHLTTTMTSAGQTRPGKPLHFLFNQHLLRPKRVRKQIESALGKHQVKLHKVSKKSSWGASVLSHNGHLLVQEDYEQEIRSVLPNSFKISSVPFRAIKQCDGGMTCLCLELGSN